MDGLSGDQTQRLIEIMMDHARRNEASELAEAYDRGFPINVRDPRGNTALMYAAYHGNIETLEMLIERRADTDIRNERDQSPVAGAIFKGEEEVVRILTRAGADLDAGTPSARQTAELFGKQSLLES